MSTTSRTDEPARVTYAGLAADDTGGDDRPPLVLLHGLTFDRRIWRPVLDRIRALDPARRIVAFDLPGHGESPARPPHDFTRVMAALGAAFDAAHIDEPVLVGHSMSGGLASLFGAHHAVTAIVNVDQPPEIAPFAQLLGTLQEQLRGPQFDEVWRVFADSFHTELLADDVRAFVETNSAPSQSTVLSYWEPLLAQPVDALVDEVDRAIGAIADHRTPYVLVVGAPLPADLEARLRARVPQLRIEDWSPSGHFPHLAHADRFAALLVAVDGS